MGRAIGFGRRDQPRKFTLQCETRSENHGRSRSLMPARTWVRQLVASALVSAAAAQSLEWTAIPYPKGDAQVRNE
jgi:hypothetical protein